MVRRAGAQFLAGGRSRGHAGPVEPKAALTSIGTTVYDWHLASDTITWGPNAAAVLGLPDLDSLSTGEAFALATASPGGETRAHAIHGSGERDDGTGVVYHTRYALRLRGDHLIAVEDTGRWFADATGRPAFAHGLIRITPLAFSGLSPTLLPGSRGAFLARIAGEVTDLARHRQSMTVVVGIIDHDGGGDAPWSEVLTRIRSILRQRDHLAIIDSHRFALALMSCPAAEAESVTRRLQVLVESEPVATGDGPVRLRLGTASLSQRLPSAAELLLHAEEALAGSTADRARMPAEPRRSVGTTPDDIIGALNDRRPVLGLQRVVDAQTRAPVFARALPRFRMPDGSLAAFGDLAASLDGAQLASLVDGRMLELAADRLAADPHERLSIRISPLTLTDPDWLATLAAHLGARPGIESRLIVSIPERAAARDPGAFRARLDAMKAVGVAVALEDFGAGYTGAKHLRSFPIDVLTLDPAFIEALSRSPDDRFFVRSLVDLAHHFGIATAAAGLDDEGTARLLADWGVDYLHSLRGDEAAQAEPLLRLGVA